MKWTIPLTVTAFCFSLILLSCSDAPTGQGERKRIREAQTEISKKTRDDGSLIQDKQFITLRLLPKDPQITDSLKLTILTRRGLELPDYTIHWYVNDELVKKGSGIFDLSSFRKGDVVYGEVVFYTTDYKSLVSEVVTVRNGIPEIKDFHYETVLVQGVYLFRVKADVSDPDNDEVTVAYRFFVNDNLVAETDRGELDISTLKRDDRIYCIIVADDGDTPLAERVTPLFSISNRPPKIVSNPPEVVRGNIFTYKITGEDPDKDELSFELVEGPDGMVLQGDTLHWDLRAFEDPGPVKTIVKVEDGHGGVANQEFNLSVAGK